MSDHPITPPADLLKRWEDAWFDEEEHPDVLLIQAFQAGADQELETCLKWLEQNQGRWEIPMALRDARRPKPPSLKEQALDAHNRMMAGTETQDDWMIIRRALEQLDD
jgi:hypothetical protein